MHNYNQVSGHHVCVLSNSNVGSLQVHHFDRYWSNAKVKGFEVYVVELMESIDLCVERNIHSRSREEIEKLAREWEETPPHFVRLDVTSLTSDSNIDEVEMECTDSDEDKPEEKRDEQVWWHQFACLCGSGRKS